MVGVTLGAFSGEENQLPCGVPETVSEHSPSAVPLSAATHTYVGASVGRPLSVVELEDTESGEEPSSASCT